MSCRIARAGGVPFVLLLAVLSVASCTNAGGGSSGDESDNADAAAVAADKAELAITFADGDDADHVRENVTLPVTGTSGSTISWTTDNEDVCTCEGVITRPTIGNSVVVLTATIAFGAAADTKKFDLVVLEAATDHAAIVAADKAELAIGYWAVDSATSVTNDLTLPTSGSSGSTISWASGSPTVVAADGTVSRPTDAQTAVTLTATITSGTVGDTKAFSVDVIELAVGKPGQAGGIIFYDDEADAVDDIVGARYLEAAPSDQSTSIQWGPNTIEIPVASFDVGDGEANTTAIVGILGINGGVPYGAKACDDLELYGHDDWFMPTHDELQELYDQRTVVGGLDSGSYWCATEYANTPSFYAWQLDFATGSWWASADKELLCRVRAIRAF